MFCLLIFYNYSPNRVKVTSIFFSFCMILLPGYILMSSSVSFVQEIDVQKLDQSVTSSCTATIKGLSYIWLKYIVIKRRQELPITYKDKCAFKWTSCVYVCMSALCAVAVNIWELQCGEKKTAPKGSFGHKHLKMIVTCLFKPVGGNKAYGSPQVLDLGRAQVCCCWGISQRMNSGRNWVACIFNLKAGQGIATFNFLLLENEILKILRSQFLKTCKQVLGLYRSLVFFHFPRASFNVCWCLEDQIGRTATESFISQHN